MTTSNSIKLILSGLALFISVISFAQGFQGQAYYFSKTTINMDNFGGREMSPDMKARIAERMKSFFEKTYILTFNQSESMYKEDEALEAPGSGGGFNFMGSFSAGPQYKNLKEGQIIQEQEFFGKEFLITDELQKLEWKMGTETKQIGKYTCFKATAMKKVDELDWQSMRRRDNADEEKKENEADSTATAAKSEEEDPMSQIEVPKEVEVTAWYTPQIPVNQGPGEYWGLPGLILEVSADRTTILCSKIVINPEEKKEIKKPTKGKVVTRAEYNETIKQKMKEMREMYGGRNRGGGFRRGGN